MLTLPPSCVRDYLDDLDRALRDLPSGRRREIVADIRSHIDAALADIPTPSPATVQQILDDLGTPETIAAAAFTEMPPTQSRWASRDVATVILLLIGGLVLPVIGWLIGAVMLWTSTTWRIKDKVIATLLVPGGLALIPLLGAFAVAGTAAISARATTVCAHSVGPGAARQGVGVPPVPASAAPVPASGAPVPALGAPVPVQSALPIPHNLSYSMSADACTGGSSGSDIFMILVLGFSVGAPLFSTFWLIRHARRIT
jgi:hypothetical protein